MIKAGSCVAFESQFQTAQCLKIDLRAELQSQAVDGCRIRLCKLMALFPALPENLTHVYQAVIRNRPQKTVALHLLNSLENKVESILSQYLYFWGLEVEAVQTS